MYVGLFCFNSRHEQEMTEAKVVCLKRLIVAGEPSEDDFEIKNVSVPDLHEGDILFRALAMSADPYLRSGFKTGPIGMISGFIAGRVEESKNPNFKKGSLWGTRLLFQTVQVISAETLKGLLMWDLSPYCTEATISLGVGALGMPGATAWGGLLDVIKPKKGETIFVSAATGAVGSLVVQIASRVVGCTGFVFCVFFVCFVLKVVSSNCFVRIDGEMRGGRELGSASCDQLPHLWKHGYKLCFVVAFFLVSFYCFQKRRNLLLHSKLLLPAEL
jgi:hypothetical protein